MHSTMNADFSVELGADDDALEFPWASPDGSLRYYDLKRQPELLADVEEASRHPELGEFLAAVNSETSVLLTAKCDAWTDTELSEAEEIYGAAVRFSSYVDLLFDGGIDPEAPFSFERNEELTERLSKLLGKAPEIAAAAEFIVRRCYLHTHDDPVRPGFYITFYLFGYGDDEPEARRRWTVGLELVQNAVLLLSAELRRISGTRRS
ncbi:MAG TPA: hypothetical protein VN622_07555 [Clostridia bacterium]|nr:hypothetical protein [Clostridia bacterium]